jgi:cohesin complex subunit SCC1
MFYSQIILAKKGPLGMIWLASHWLEKLKKVCVRSFVVVLRISVENKFLYSPVQSRQHIQNQIFATDIKTSVGSIVTPVVPLALRVSGHLLLGVVRIYDRKVKYLFVDCNDAVSKIKLAFSGDVVDLPEKAFEATTLNVADFGSFDDDGQFEESTNIDKWASLALKQNNRQISTNDIDVRTTKGVRSIIDDSSKENSNFRQTNRKWLAFDDGLDDGDDELDAPEVLRNAPTETTEMDVLDQSMDDPETLRRGVTAQESQRISLEAQDGDDGMIPYEDDAPPPMDDMDDSMDDLGRFSNDPSQLQLSPSGGGFQDDEEEEEENTASLKKARRRKRRKLGDIDTITKLSASSRKRRAGQTFQRTTTLRRRLEPIWGDKTCVVQISRPMCSLAAAPALRRLISSACMKAAQQKKFIQQDDDSVFQKEDEEEEEKVVDDEVDVPFMNDDEDTFPPMDDYDDGFRQSSLGSVVATPSTQQTSDTTSEENMSSYGGVRLHERTKRVIEDLHPELVEKGSISDFRDTLRPGASRQEVAAGFFELLVLATKHNLVGLNQQKSYGPIRVTPTEKLKAIAV